eukprot:TRINITY_DN3529_c0_g1_i2.p1 TRINITY_DN3529_c0_g1~~TRINITY_DN3529_c0_g1_i2.p1  ORF type:complete len:609 (-),score=231.41 TRINITY_DN3529_c0_g1_i2:397-2175(-)
MGKKKRWIDKKKPSVTYRVIHRSQADVHYFADDAPGHVLERVKGPDILHVDVPREYEDDECDESEYTAGQGSGGGPRGAPSREAIVSVKRMEGPGATAAEEEIEKIRKAVADEEFAVDLSFPDDGYDYTQHMKAMGEGQFVSAPGMEHLHHRRTREASAPSHDGPPGSEKVHSEGKKKKGAASSTSTASSAAAATESVPSEIALCLPREVFAYEESTDEYGFAPAVLPGDVRDALDPEILAALEDDDLEAEELDDDFVVTASQWNGEEDEEGMYGEEADEEGEEEDEDDELPPLERDPAEEQDENEKCSGRRTCVVDGVAVDAERDEDTGMLVRGDDGDTLGYKVLDPPNRKLGVVVVGKKQIPADVYEKMFARTLENYADDDMGELEYDDPSLAGTHSLQEFESLLDETVAESQPPDLGERERTFDYQQEMPQEYEYVNIKVKPVESWDVQSVTTTYTDTENHPAVIDDDVPIIRVSAKTGLPIAPKLNKRALKRIAERERRAKRMNGEESDEEEMDSDEESVAESVNMGEGRPKDESKDDKKARKAAVKELRRQRRAQKKETKLRFKREEIRQVKTIQGQKQNSNAVVKF